MIRQTVARRRVDMGTLWQALKRAGSPRGWSGFVFLGQPLARHIVPTTPAVWRLPLQELRDKYTRSDLDGLAEEEKQAWLEVIEGHREAAVKEAAEVGLQASSQGAAALDSTAPEGKSLQNLRVTFFIKL